MTGLSVDLWIYQGLAWGGETRSSRSRQRCAGYFMVLLMEIAGSCRPITLVSNFWFRVQAW